MHTSVEDMYRSSKEKLSPESFEEESQEIGGTMKDLSFPDHRSMESLSPSTIRQRQEDRQAAYALAESLQRKSLAELKKKTLSKSWFLTDHDRCF